MASAAALSVVFALLLLTLLLARRSRPGAGARGLDVVATVRLSPQASAAVVRAGERYFLLASTGSAVTSVAELDARDWAGERGVPVEGAAKRARSAASSGG